VFFIFYFHDCFIEKEVSDKLNLLGTLARNFKGKGSVAFVNCGYVECNGKYRGSQITKYHHVLHANKFDE
jgi:hypothetical protein